DLRQRNVDAAVAADESDRPRSSGRRSAGWQLRYLPAADGVAILPIPQRIAEEDQLARDRDLAVGRSGSRPDEVSRAQALEQVVEPIGSRQLRVVDPRLQAQTVLDGAPVESEAQVLLVQHDVGVLRQR